MLRPQLGLPRICIRAAANYFFISRLLLGVLWPGALAACERNPPAPMSAEEPLLLSPELVLVVSMGSMLLVGLITQLVRDGNARLVLFIAALGVLSLVVMASWQSYLTSGGSVTSWAPANSHRP